MQVEIIREVAGLEAARDEWTSLLAQSAQRSPFLTPEWLITWWKQFGGRGNLLVVCLRDRKGLVGIAPLQVTPLQVRGIRYGRQLGFATGSAADYRDFIVRAGEEWDFLETLLVWMRDELPDWNALILRGIHGASRSNELLPVMARAQGLFAAAILSATCPFIPLPGSYDDFLATMSRATRSKYAQKWRKLQRDRGEPQLRVLQGEEVTVREINTFLELHEMSWEDRRGSRALALKGVGDFHRELVTALAATGWPLMAFLTLEGRDISCIYGFLGDGIFYDYLPGYDPAYSPYSLGAQAILRLIEYGIGKGWREFDFMQGAERYKFHFTRCCRYNVEHIIARSPRVFALNRVLEALQPTSS